MVMNVFEANVHAAQKNIIQAILLLLFGFVSPFADNN